MTDEFETITGQVISKDDIRDTKINFYKSQFEEGKSPITDFEEGRIARLVVDSDLDDSYELRYLIDQMGRMFFPEDAVGEFLDNCGFYYKCTRKPSTNSNGELLFYLEDEETKNYDIIISAATIISTDDEEGFEVETITDVTLPAGQNNILVPAESIEDGSEYNILQGKLTLMNEEIDDLLVTNPEAFTGGIDAEDDESYRERILNSAEGLLPGSEPWFKAMAENYSGVHDAFVFIKDEGYYNIEIIINSQRKPILDSFINDLMNFFYSSENKLVGLNPLVKGAKLRYIDVSLSINVDQNFDPTTVSNNIKNDILAFGNGGTTSKNVKQPGFNINEGLLRTQLYSVISTVDGVINYDLHTPIDDIDDIGGDEVIVISNIEIDIR
jgi:uncharacterized phage protein gp47/JayE